MSPSINQIIGAVSDAFGVPEHEITGPCKEGRLMPARFAVVHLSREMTDKSLPVIGRELGGRDHTTILNAERRASEMADQSFEYRGLLAKSRNRALVAVISTLPSFHRHGSLEASHD
jgi:chromosomal replication initiation ATPase DnaA